MDELLELTIDRPAAGGRMIARHAGGVVFVAHAIPGERVRARVTRTSRQMSWADATEILEPSRLRRTPPADPLCGGLSYAHIEYEGQLQLKGEVIADAFRRIARQPLDEIPRVAASPERGYRMRARLHVRRGRAGFFREGTHEICDAGATGQLLPESIAAVDGWLKSSGAHAGAIEAVSIIENVRATERLLHLDLKPGAKPEALGAVALTAGITGLSCQSGPRVVPLAGARTVADTAGDLLGESSVVPRDVRWTRRPTSFFQGNRFLTGRLVSAVVDLARGDRVIDLYSGVGLFAVALAATGAQVLAVEGEASSGADLSANARPFGERLHVERAAVEAAVRTPLDPPPDVVVLDPPRTGVSAAALAGLIAWRAPRLVYVSCDPPTLARDAARLREAGYALRSIEGFDLFPNTAHIESLALFERPAHAGPLEERNRG